MRSMFATQPDAVLTAREVEIRALEAMDAEVRESGSGFPPLMKSKAGEDRQILCHIAGIIGEDIAPQLAMTDPARYRKLARLRTEIILRGFYVYFSQLLDPR